MEIYSHVSLAQQGDAVDMLQRAIATEKANWRAEF
jgi:hypothetical protein